LALIILEAFGLSVYVSLAVYTFHDKQHVSSVNPAAFDYKKPHPESSDGVFIL